MEFGLRSSRAAGPTLAMALFATGTLFAQRPMFRSFTNTGRLPSGIQVENLTWNTDYFQLSAPAGILPIDQRVSLGSAVGFGAGMTLAWYHRTSRSDYEIRYSGAYEGFTRQSQLRGYDQEITIGFRRKVTPRLQWDFFANGQSTKLSELLLSPMGNAAIVQGATSVTDLSSALSTGASTDVGLNPTATNASSLDSPLLLLLSPARLEIASVATSVVYSATPNLYWFGHAAADRYWYRQNGVSRENGLSVVPPHNEIAGSVGLAYKIRRRTEFGLDLEYNRSGSQYYLANAVDAVLSLKRTLSERWFIGARGGPGLVTTTNLGATNDRRSRQEGYAAGAMAGYKGMAHSFLFAADRTVTGRFGLGEDHNVSGSFAWNWEQRSSPWSFSSTLTYERLGGGALRRLDGWLLSASAGRYLTPRTVIIAQFVTATNSSPSSTAFDGVVRRSARLSLVWNPSPKAAHRR